MSDRSKLFPSSFSNGSRGRLFQSYEFNQRRAMTSWHTLTFSKRTAIIRSNIHELSEERDGATCGADTNSTVPTSTAATNLGFGCSAKVDLGSHNCLAISNYSIFHC